MRLNMDSSRAEFSYLPVVTEDADSFDKVAELYFEARDNANDEEAYDSPSVLQAWNQTYRRKQK